MIGKGLKEIANRIEASMTLSLNEHKAVYEGGFGYYVENTSTPPHIVGSRIDYAKDIWELQIYPDTPIGFYRAISNDLAALITWGLAATERSEQ